MKNKYEVSVGITKPDGRRRKIVKAGITRLPSRVVHFLFGDATTILLLKPGQDVSSIDVWEEGKS